MEHQIPTSIKEVDAVHGHLSVDRLKVDPGVIEGLRRYPSSEWDLILAMALGMGFKVMEVIDPEDWTILRRYYEWQRITNWANASQEFDGHTLHQFRQALRQLDWRRLRQRWEAQMERDVEELLAEWIISASHRDTRDHSP
ncbi:MAG: hypothetical protein OWU33_01445 [Firmicutes bacterium]|nr:hypothetical protein [Bacillota bacterium]